VTCTFVNQHQRGAIRIAKTRKHAADGPGSHPQAGVTFQVSGGNLVTPIAAAPTDADGITCVDGLVLGSYTVTEDLPAGYAIEGGEASKVVEVTAEASCPAGAFASTVSFSNIPLTTITISVDSIVPGGTASTISCTGFPTVATAAGTGDGTATLSAVQPGAYTCTLLVDP
jgi:hypothetical protein